TERDGVLNYLAAKTTEEADGTADGGTAVAFGWRYFVEFLFWLGLMAAGAALFALLVIAPAFAGIAAQIEGQEQNGFGRIVITFDKLPVYRNELSAGVFVLSFDEGIDVSLDRLKNELPVYVGMARRDPDGTALRIALNRSFQVNLMEAGRQLFIDLLPSGWKGPPPPLPSHVIKELSAQALAAERKAREEARQREAMKNANKLDVRLLKQPTFVRLVFDWNTFATADVSRSGSEVSLKFNQMANVSLAEVKSGAPRYLRNISADNSPGGLVVSLTVDDDVDVRGFREGMTYVLDLTGPERSSEASVAEVAKVTGVSDEPAASVPEQAKDQILVKAAGAEMPPAGKPAPPVIATQSAPLDPSAIPVGQTPPGDLPEMVQTPPAAASPSHAADTAPAIPAVPIASTPPAPAASAPVQTKKELAPTPEMQASAAASTEPEEISRAIRADDNGANLKLTFPFREKTASAVFLRGETVWIVFDSEATLDASALDGIVGKKIVSYQHIRGQGMQYFRLRLSKPWLAYATQNQNSWVVDVGDMVTGKAEPLLLQRRLREDKQSLIAVKLDDPGHVRWIADPAVGDSIAVVTAFAPVRGIFKPQDFVEFSALPTAHGLAVRTNSDDVAVRLQIDEVIITRRAGLTLSAGKAPQYARGRKPLDSSPRTGFLDLASWDAPTPAQFSKQVSDLQRKIALMPEAQRNEHRFRLARLFAAQMFAPEAVGTLNRMVEQDPDVGNDPAFSALLGAELALMGRVAEARKAFDSHALAHDRDVGLWRGFLDAQDKDWASALSNFSSGIDVIRTYRPDMQALFRLTAARAALESGKLTRAAEELDGVPESGLTPDLLTEADLLRGRYLDRVGRTTESVESYERVLSSERQPQSAEATWRLVVI
ncbi:MAG: hypothetical protein VX871_00695, partial [Pseudomonadota bacterium]|nr:hypothetical protein [Pseudomonadota bacterium]